MKQVLIVQGRASTEEVPAPQVRPGTLLVQVTHSCISIGTELSALKANADPIWKRALKNPEKVKDAFQLYLKEGFSKTKEIISNYLEAGEPTGYSATGKVIAIGAGVEGFAIDQSVACAGAQYAHHAEIICVPENLVVRVPENLDSKSAATVTLGAIALQGVRRAQPTLGETFVVLGLGLIGQITVQILKANGCRVIGMDLDQARIDRAMQLGLDEGISPTEDQKIERIFRLTEGIGADGVIITASSPADDIISTAFKICRRKARVVLVGDIGLNLNRADFYQKEIDFLISTSYGPGRYDKRYEEEGLDYPVSYVRWTENRNLEEYLKLLANKKVSVEQMIDKTFKVEEAATAYRSLHEITPKPLAVLLSYTEEKSVNTRVQNPKFLPTSHEGKIGIAIIGAGSFVKNMHVPNLKRLSEFFEIQAVVSRTGHNAMSLAKSVGAAYSTTSFEEVLNDPKINTVMITTRHDCHAQMALTALKANKNVFVEKPLALNRTELQSIADFYKEAEFAQAPVLLTGFNRRFSKLAKQIKEKLAKRTGPLLINYRMNSGAVGYDHWVHSPEGGGRNIGEACHIYDLFTFYTESKVKSVHARALAFNTKKFHASDNFVSLITFHDGSICNLTYTSEGSSQFPKEMMEIFVDGSVISLEDYRILKFFDGKVSKRELSSIDKGQFDELLAFGECLKSGSAWPIPLWNQIQATEISFKVEEQLKQGITE